jgi:hypothetical protein
MRIAAAAGLVVVAVLAVLLARDVNASRDALAQGDAVYAVTPGKATWTAPTVLGGAAQALLGTREDVQLRRALQLYTLAASTPSRLDTAVEAQTLRSQAATALADAAHGAHASQAQTLLGVLAFATSADEAEANFTDAVRADPSNAAAKYDLELLLRLAAAHGSREGAGPGGTFGRGGRRGAGGGVPGSGY